MRFQLKVFGGRFSLGLLLVFGVVNAAYSLEPPLPEPTVPSLVPKPILLSHRDQMPDKANVPLPLPPQKYNDGSRLSLSNDQENPPLGAALQDLTDTQTLHQIPRVNKIDRKSGKYYWHPFKGWNYCHFHKGKRHWYGWRTGGTFHWILWQRGRFWWHDNHMRRWIYFDRGYWWWRGGKNSKLIQVMLPDGKYHTCGKNGVLADKPQNGTGNEMGGY